MRLVINGIKKKKLGAVLKLNDQVNIVNLLNLKTVLRILVIT